MTDKSYPLDAIGNNIRKDDLVRVSLAEAALVFQVTDVQPGGVLRGPDDSPLSMNGTITVSVTIPIQYAPGTILSNILVLKTPEQGGLNNGSLQ